MSRVHVYQMMMMTANVSEMIDRAKGVNESDAKEIINFLRRMEINKSETLQSFVEDYSGQGRYCIVGNAEGKDCIPSMHVEVLVNFLLNLEALVDASSDLLRVLNEKIMSKKSH